MITNRFAAAIARHTGHAFTLMEVLITIVVLALLILLATQVINTAATVVRPANKHVDTDTQARAVFDRMAVDFGQMLKRTDVDYYFKANANKYPGHSGGHSKGGGVAGQTDLNDYIAFYSQVSGYSTGSPSPMSLVAYRVNGLSTSASYNKLERLGKGLFWNGVTNTNSGSPIVFLPLTIAGTWPAVTNNVQDPDGNYETIGPQVFRFEYYYLLKNGTLTDTPWDTAGGHTSINGLKDVEAIAVTIAAIDPQSRSLLTDQNVLDLQQAMNDFKTQKGLGPVKTGVLETQWNTVVTNPTVTPAGVPHAAVSAIRIYNRYFDLKIL